MALLLVLATLPTGVIGVLLAVCTATSIGAVTALVLWAVFAGVFGVLLVPGLRRRLITRPVLNIFRRVLPTLSATERTLARRLFTGRGAPCLKCHMTGDPAHDRDATAPNFLVAAERLKPDWTYRWMLEPANIAPGTAMPSELFRHEQGRWIFNGRLPAVFEGYEGDHAQLLVRYMFQFTPAELRRLRSSGVQ